MSFLSTLVLALAGFSSLLIGFFGVGKPERGTRFVQVLLVVGGIATVLACVFQYLQTLQSDKASAKRDKESKEHESALNAKLASLSADNQELRNMVAPVLAEVRKQHPDASDKEALAFARAELEKRTARLEQQTARLEQRTDAIASAELTLVFESETPNRPVGLESDIHFSGSIELRTARGAPGFRFSGTVADEEQATPTLQRNRQHFTAVAGGGLLGRPISLLREVQVLALPPDFVRDDGIGKPKRTHVLLTVNGITVELRPVALPWSKKPITEAIVNISEDMKHIDERIGAALADRQK
jgi:hypothetical protein